MTLVAFITRLLGDRRGATAIIVAGSLFALVGSAAVAVDLGSVYLAKRRLQGVADAAALAAAGEAGNAGRASAQAIIDRSGVADVTIGNLTTGRYRRDTSVPLDNRFEATPASPSAARIELRQEVPLFFGILLSGQRGMTITAEATATRNDMAAFSLGTKLAQLSGGVPNQILSALAGTQLGLTLVDSQGLATTDVDILHFADALRLRVGRPEATYAQIFGSEIPLNTVIGALADATLGNAATVLSSIEAKVGGNTIKLSDMIDLGPIGQNDFNDGNAQIKVDVLSLLRSTLELSNGDHYEVNLNLTALGLVGTKVRLVGGQGEVPSPWMTVTDGRDVVIRSAQTRLYLDTELGTGPLGLLSIRLPIYIELAAAEARLAAITCGSGGDSDGVTLEVTPAVGTLAIAEIDEDAMGDLTSPMSLEPAVLAYTLLAQVDGFAKVSLGGVTPQEVHFTRQDIADRRVRSVKTNDLVGGVTASLLKNIQISASLLRGTVLGGLLTVNLGPLASAVGSKLSGIAPVLDTLIGQITDTLGLRLGIADVRVNKMQCGVPVLVA